MSEHSLNVGDRVRLTPQSSDVYIPSIDVGQIGTIINLTPHPASAHLIGQVQLDYDNNRIWWIAADSVELPHRKFGQMVTPTKLPEGSYIVIADETEDGFVHILSKTGEDYLVKAEDLL